MKILTYLDGALGARGYAHYYDPDDPSSGSLVIEQDSGSTLLPPYQGQFTVLDAVSSKEEAVREAREWEEIRGRGD